MVGKVSAVVLGGLLLAAAFAAPEALARRGGGPGGGRCGYGSCRQQAACGCDQEQVGSRQRQRDGSCRQDPSQCPNRADCSGPGGGTQRKKGTGKGADTP
jgi:hypothetical protein